MDDRKKNIKVVAVYLNLEIEKQKIKLLLMESKDVIYYWLNYIKYLWIIA